MTLKEKRIAAFKKECSLNKNKTEIKKDVKMNITVHDVIHISANLSGIIFSGIEALTPWHLEQLLQKKRPI